MKENYAITGKVYLKSGVTIEEECVILKEDFTEEEARVIFDKFKNSVKQGLKGTEEFQFTLGDTIFRGTEVAAATLKFVYHE